jgi:peroxiredoxin-like protein
MSSQEHSYEVNLKWKDGRVGTMHSPELDESIEVATPPDFKGGVEGIWSPEHMFVASVSSCLMTTFLAIADYSKLSYEDLNINAVGQLGKKDGKFMVTEIILKPELVITDTKHKDKALRILEKAEAACLVTHSIKTEVTFEPEVEVGVYS